MRSLEEMNTLNMMQPPQPQAPQANPLSSGSLAAMAQIKKMLAADDNQKRRSLGAAIGKFGAHMGNPANYQQDGFRGALGAATMGLSPALQTYNEGLQGAQQENLGVLELLRKLEADQQEQARYKDKLDYQNSQLAETKRYHDLMYKEADNSAFERMKSEGMVPEDAIPYSMMGKKEQGEVAKEQRMRLENIKQANTTLKKMREIVAISNDYPDLSTDWNRLLISSNGNIPKASDIAALKISDPERRFALETFRKLNAELLATKVQASGGKVATDIFKKTLRDTLMDPSSSNKTINYIGKFTESELQPLLDEEEDLRKAISGRYAVPQRINSSADGEIKEEKPTIWESFKNPETKDKKTSSNESITKKADLLSAKGFKPEEIQALYDAGDL